MAPSGSVSGHEQIPGHGVPVGHCVEHLTSEPNLAALGVVGDEVVAQEHIKMSGFDDPGVESLPLG